MAQINKANEYFNTVTHTGDGTSPRTITGVIIFPYQIVNIIGSYYISDSIGIISGLIMMIVVD